METLSQAINRLRGDGFVHDYDAVGTQLVCSKCETAYDPAATRVVEIVRFEGASDPGDQSILFALDTGCGHRGLYASAYGPEASADDVAVTMALPDQVG